VSPPTASVLKLVLSSPLIALCANHCAGSRLGKARAQLSFTFDLFGSSHSFHVRRHATPVHTQPETSCLHSQVSVPGALVGSIGVLPGPERVSHPIILFGTPEKVDDRQHVRDICNACIESNAALTHCEVQNVRVARGLAGNCVEVASHAHGACFLCSAR
jgi:hypothetical protein